MKPEQVAARAVALILAQLEADTGSLVRSIGLRRVDGTTIDAARHFVSVEIELAREPGHDWR